MAFAQAFVGEIISIVIFVMLIAGMMKVFQMATDMRDMKEVLRDIRRNTQAGAVPASGVAAVAVSAPPVAAPSPYSASVSSPALAHNLSSPSDVAPLAQAVAGTAPPAMTAEELVRAVHAQKFSDDEFPLDSPVFPPRS